MFIISEGLNDGRILSLIPKELDEILDKKKVGLVQIELSDVSRGISSVSPEIGLGQALILAREDYKIILVGKREYPELAAWNDVISISNVCFCKEEEVEEKLLSCIKKLIQI